MCLKRSIVLLAACASFACAASPDAPVGPPDENLADEPASAPAELTSARASAGANTQGHLALQIRADQGGMQLVRVTPVNAPLPKWRGKARNSPWQAQALSDTHALLYSVGLADPREVHGEFTDPATGQQQRVSRTQSGPVDFVVRVPTNTAQVDFFGQVTNTLSASPLGSVTLPKP